MEQTLKMADTQSKTDEAPKKTLTLSKGKLSLAGREVAQTGPRGKTTSTVQVQVKRRKIFKPGEEGAEELKSEVARPHENESQRLARLKALEDSQRTSEESLPKRPSGVGQPQVVERPEIAIPEATEESARPASPSTFKPEPRKTASEAAEEEQRKKKSLQKRGEEDEWRRKKLTLTEALRVGTEEEERLPSLAAVKRAREKKARQLGTGAAPKEYKKQVREVKLPETITVSELANRMAEPVASVIKVLMKMGVMVTATNVIDADTAELVTSELGHTVRRVSETDVEIDLHGIEDDARELEPRPPVVTVMGHVDHGKTSLLDALKKTDVAAHEAGGITQHIGAYKVTPKSGQSITFIDTPGHEAFTAMRARGANTTDIVILVVAANDGVMAQTIEAIQHAKAAEVPIIVAINKIDVPGADPMRVKTQLLSYDIVSEDMGGDVLTVEVSALKKIGLDKLEEAIQLQAEVLELKANPNRNAIGSVIESRLDQGRGAVATVLVQKGTLKLGDIFVAGAEWGRIRGLIDDKGQSLKVAGPSDPVEIIGLNGTPFAGDDFVVVPTEARAREISTFRQRKLKEKALVIHKDGTSGPIDIFSRIQEGNKKILGLIIKADVHGSLEALKASLTQLTTDEIGVKVITGSVGAVSEADITLAKASGAHIVAFNVRANPQARDIAKAEGIPIRYYSIIYEAIDDARKLMTGMLSPEMKEEFIGYAEVRDVFNITGVGKVAGCYVTSGVVKRGAGVRLLRDNVVIHEGTLKTLKRFKDEVKEVSNGYECGMAFENYDDLKSGDVIECYERRQVARTL